MVKGSPPRPARVFISSASGGLDPYRAAAADVCRRLGMVAVLMEEFSPERLPPIEVCQRELESCDVLILLLAYRYGSRPDGFQESYTELEYGWAMDRPEMAVLPFQVESDFPWPPSDIDRGPDGRALKSFVQRVASRHVIKYFGHLGLFREDLIIALRQYQKLPEPYGKTAHQATGTGKFKIAWHARATRYWITSPPTLHAVPSYVGNAPFTGRIEQLEALDAWAVSADPVMVVEAIGGVGKSALTWQWTTTHATGVINGLAGRLWWSFYDGSASMKRFLQEVLCYTTQRRMEHIREMSATELSTGVLTALKDRPYLLVLDGFERLLAAYHMFDPSKLRDEEVMTTKRSLIEPHAHEVLRELTHVAPSKVLISSRLMPDALEGRFGQCVPNVTHVRLPGLTDADTIALLARLGVYGEHSAINDFFGQLGNHPLLIGIVAGLIRDYRPQPGSFDKWHADPDAGGAFALPELDLSQRRSHILAAALDGLEPSHRRLLGYISVLVGTVDWPTLEDINPFHPPPPISVEPRYWKLDNIPSGRRYEMTVKKIESEAAAANRAAFTKWRASESMARARAMLDLALKDLEDRGLLWWDRASNTYDLHPIVRAVTHDQFDEGSRVQANERIRAHFEALPSEPPATASSVEQLRIPITLFRSLVGARHFERAHSVWLDSLRKPILLEIGATATAIELLAPLAAGEHANHKVELGFALFQAGRYEEAHRQDLDALRQWLREGSRSGVLSGLGNVTADCIALGRLASANQYLRLWETLPYGRRRSSVYQRALLAAKRGAVEPAFEWFNRAISLESDAQILWFDSMIRFWRLYLAFRAYDSVTEADLDAADRVADNWLERRNLMQLRRDFFLSRGDPGRALEAAFECDRMERDAGIESVPAATAYILAVLGRTDEAATAVDEVLHQLPRLEEAVRPHYDLSRALYELGWKEDAIFHAQEAYRQAWGEGRPYCNHWNLLDAEAQLTRLDEPLLDLTAIDNRSRSPVPLEDEIRIFREVGARRA